MDNIINNLQISREELERRLKWYESKYGAYVYKKGFHNWKNLFRKPNIYDWTILFMLLMGLFIGWAYNHDIGACREFLSTIDDKACEICNTQIEQATNPFLNNLSIINEENPITGEI